MRSPVLCPGQATEEDTTCTQLGSVSSLTAHVRSRLSGSEDVQAAIERSILLLLIVIVALVF